jgi:hypothetical protein
VCSDRQERLAIVTERIEAAFGAAGVSSLPVYGRVEAHELKKLDVPREDHVRSVHVRLAGVGAVGSDFARNAQSGPGPGQQFVRVPPAS